MALSDHITDLITAASELPNGVNKNKLISHLRDAEAHAIVIETYTGEQSGIDGWGHAPSEPVGKYNCICKPGMYDTKCPVHGTVNLPKPPANLPPM